MLKLLNLALGMQLPPLHLLGESGVPSSTDAGNSVTAGSTAVLVRSGGCDADAERCGSCGLG